MRRGSCAFETTMLNRVSRATAVYTGVSLRVCGSLTSRCLELVVPTSKRSACSSSLLYALYTTSARCEARRDRGRNDREHIVSSLPTLAALFSARSTVKIDHTRAPWYLQVPASLHISYLIFCLVMQTPALSPSSPPSAYSASYSASVSCNQTRHNHPIDAASE